jgi:DNA repair protein RecO (recombination protein O)
VTLVSTDAFVLHAFDYLESSRILRLVTREAGLLSVIARGARKSGSKHGSSVDLFVNGAAQIYTKPGRELNNLSSFEVAVARPALGAELERFTAASALAELTLRFAQAENGDVIYDGIIEAFDALAHAPLGGAREAALAGAWALVARLGFAPSLESCAGCHASLGADEPAAFNHQAGGLLCERCARFAPGSRLLPPSARATLLLWIAGERTENATDAELRAHQRLLREFLGEHLTDGRPLRAFDVWERARWSTAI